MCGFLRPDRLSAFLVAAFLFAGFAAESRAGPLAEFLFWDSLGNTVGEGLQAHADYRAERQLWQDNIAAAKSELERCGGCASAQAELDKWQGIENQFQEVAGGLAQSVGMPPVVANWLGIDLPMAPPRPPGYFKAQKKRQMRNLVRQDWVAERPEYCGIAVDAHLDCLRRYLSSSGILDKLSGAESPGGICYDTSKFYQHCLSEDYEAFDREKTVQEARALGAIIPEHFAKQRSVGVYYGQVPDDFMPTFPPPDSVREELNQESIREVVITHPPLR